MGQIIGSAAKPRRCNLQSLSQLGTPAAGEYILVSSDNSMNAAGQGNFDSYIVGDGTHVLSRLELKPLNGNYVQGDSLNKFDKNRGLLCGYVNTTGGIQPASGDTYLTAKVKIKANTDYAIGFTSTHSSWASLFMSARDANGNNASVVIDGTSYTYYTYGNKQKTVFRVNYDGETCFVAFTVKFNTQDARNYLMLVEGTELPSVYTPYSLIIPKGKFDSSEFVSSEQLEKIEEEINAFESSKLVEKKGDATLSTNAFMQTTGTPITASYWNYYTLQVVEGQKYTISATAGQSARLWVCCDANGGVLSYSSDSSLPSLKSENITVPKNGTTLYVNYRATSGDAIPSILYHESVINAGMVYVGQESIIDYINRIISDGDNVASLDFTTGNTSYIVSPFNDTYDIKTYFKLSRESSQNGNPCFNFNGVYLVNKTTGVESIVHSCGDDITPAQYNNTYIGANHADSDMRKVTCNGHGKTYADIGSVWTNGTGYFTIVAVIDANTLWILSNNIATYPKFRFSGPVTGTLTHVSGATHTDDIVISASVVQQFYSALRVADLSVIIDGKKVTESGVYSFKNLNICENYDIINPASVLELIKAGVGTFTENPNPNSFTSADKVARHSIVYGFKNAGAWTIATDFIAYQDIDFNYFGFTQMSVISGTNRKMYIPKALPIGGKDFRQIADFTTISSALNFTSEYWENPNLPPDRWMEFSDSIAVHSGYLFDYGVGGNNRKDYVSNAIFLNTTLKTYPYGADNKITVNAGDVLSAVVWRTYLDPSKVNSNGIIATNSVEYAGKCYVYADFNSTGVFDVEIPADYVGKEISVFEKSDNVSILSEISNKKVLVKVDTASPLYGYLVFQIK